MVLDVARSIYEAKYKEDVKLEQYLSYLQNGINLLASNALARSKSHRELTEMNLALEYNMELMLSAEQLKTG